jgi:hypothetical protein
MKRTLVLAVVLYLAALASDNSAVAPQAAASLQSTVVGHQSSVTGTEAVTIPQMLSYQGKLTDTLGQPVLDGSYALTFRLYTQPTGGSAIWSEGQTILVKRGLFSALLGAVTPITSLPDAGALYLSLQVAADPELSPRLRIASAAYAYLTERAASADLLQGKDTTALDARYVNEGQADAVNGMMLVDGTVLTADVGDTAVTMAKIARAGATTGQVVKWTGSAWAPGPDNTGGGSGVTNVYQDTGIVCVPNPITSTGNVKLDLSYGDGRYVNVTGDSLTGALRVQGDLRVYGKGRFGPSNTNTGTGAFVVGQGNVVGGSYASVTGGQDNSADGVQSHVGGGGENKVDGDYAFVGGGQVNYATGGRSAIAGGSDNEAYGLFAAIAGGRANIAGDAAGDTCATVAGGRGNLATGMFAFVGGGQDDTASGMSATVAGGEGNRASGFEATVGGGWKNTAGGQDATVGGGYSNDASGSFAFVGGGTTGTAAGSFAVVAGGSGNSAAGRGGFVGGGIDNTAGAATTDTTATIAGGYGNQATGRYASVGGGKNDTASSSYATVGGGHLNRAAGYASVVPGGYANDAGGQHSAVGGGSNNEAGSDHSAVAGGYSNRAFGIRAFAGGGGSNYAGDSLIDTSATVVGGDNNLAGARYAFVGGGKGDTASGSYATIGGGYSNDAAGDYATIGGGYDNRAPGNYVSIGGGYGNNADTLYATVGGGYNNDATGSYSTVGGGSTNKAETTQATVGGGGYNIASGTASTVPGGYYSAASGNRSFAAGTYAKARGAGSFVWSDSCASGDSVRNATDNRWVARARGGVYFYTNLGMTTGAYLAAGSNSWESACDSATKEDFRPVDRGSLLDKVASLRVRNYKMKDQNDGTRHIGPVAQDFHSAFGYGGNETSINMADADGVALAAIQALYDQNQALSKRVAELEARLAGRP